MFPLNTAKFAECAVILAYLSTSRGMFLNKVTVYISFVDLNRRNFRPIKIFPYFNRVVALYSRF